MGIFSFVTKRYVKPGAGNKKTPEKGFSRFIFILYNYFWKLVVLNLMFILFCIPIITIPAALAGMNRVVIKLTREGYCFLWYDFWTEFKSNFFKSLLLGIIFGIIVFILWLSFNIYLTKFSGIIITVATVLIIIISGFVYAASCYMFALNSLVKLKLKDIIKNSILLTIVNIKRTLLLILIPGPILLLFILFVPLTLPIFLFFAFSFIQLIISIIVNEPIQQYIIEPFRDLSASQSISSQSI